MPNTYFYDELSPAAQDRAFNDWVERGGDSGEANALSQEATESVYSFFESIGVEIGGCSFMSDPKESYIKVYDREVDVSKIAEDYGYSDLSEVLLYCDDIVNVLDIREAESDGNWIGNYLAEEWNGEILSSLDLKVSRIIEKVDDALASCGLDYDAYDISDRDVSDFEDALKEAGVDRDIRSLISEFNKSIHSLADRAASEISDEMSYYQTSRDYFEEYSCENIEFSGNGSVYSFGWCRQYQLSGRPRKWAKTHAVRQARRHNKIEPLPGNIDDEAWSHYEDDESFGYGTHDDKSAYWRLADFW